MQRSIWLPRLMQLRVRVMCSFEKLQGSPGIAFSCRFTTLLRDCRVVRRVASIWRVFRT